MRNGAFVQFLDQLKPLTPRQRKMLSHPLDNRSDVPVAPLSGPTCASVCCPHCQANADCVAKWGRGCGLPRYRCDACEKTFNALTGTSLAQAAAHRAEHESGIVEADETFFLESFKGQRQLPRSARRRGGAAYTCGINAEQISVLVVCDRSGQTADFKLEKLDAPHVIAVLQPLVDQDAILCTDIATLPWR